MRRYLLDWERSFEAYVEQNKDSIMRRWRLKRMGRILHGNTRKGRTLVLGAGEKCMPALA